MSQKIISVLSRYGCMSLPKPCNITDLIYQCAIYELCSKPSAAINEMRKGIEPVKKFWQPLSAEDLTLICTSFLPTLEKVLKLIDDSDPCPEYERILGYLRQYVGSMSKQKLANFLRYVSGSPCCPMSINVTFNHLEGLGRRITVHTCTTTMDIPATYLSYLEFEKEFDAILYCQDPHVWSMDAL